MKGEKPTNESYGPGVYLVRGSAGGGSRTVDASASPCAIASRSGLSPSGSGGHPTKTACSQYPGSGAWNPRSFCSLAAFAGKSARACKIASLRHVRPRCHTRASWQSSRRHTESSRTPVFGCKSGKKALGRARPSLYRRSAPKTNRATCSSSLTATGEFFCPKLRKKVPKPHRKRIIEVLSSMARASSSKPGCIRHPAILTQGHGQHTTCLG